MSISTQKEENNIQISQKISKTLIKAVKIYNNTYLITKRILDIVLSSIAIVILIPFFLIIAIIIKLDSKGKVFFVHKRIGKDGKEINIYKFRTMVENAEDLIKDFTEEQKIEFEENYKLKKDPRVTRVGKFLRKTYLDELPQIFNILKGELTIIGPRPVVKKELEKYEENKEKLLSVKPGLIGYWQVNRKADTTYEERIKMELYYVDNMNLWLDIKIFFKAIFVVFKGEGAV